MALSEYVRHLLREKKTREPGLKDNQIAARIGASTAYISGFQSGSIPGVGGKTIEGWRQFFDFKSVKELRNAAYDWYRTQEGALAARLEEQPFQEALDLVVTLHPHQSPEKIRAIAYRFSDPSFAGRDRDYWIRTLSEEVRIEYVREQTNADVRKQRAIEKRAENRTIENAFREGHKIRREQQALDDEAILDEIEQPPAPTEKSVEMSGPKRKAR